MIISREAEKALLSAEAPREGARLTGVIGEGVYAELGSAGLIGAGRGLTRRGVIMRDRLREALYAEAF